MKNRVAKFFLLLFSSLLITSCSGFENVAFFIHKKKKPTSNSLIDIHAPATNPVDNQCPYGTHFDKEKCVSDVRVCLVSNGLGSEYWDGSKFGTCQTESCENGYFKAEQSCHLITYVAEYSEYETNKVTKPCEGTQMATRTIESCTRNHDSISVDKSFCIDQSASITYQSPAGEDSSVVDIENGIEYMRCDQGATDRYFARRLCDVGYVDNGNTCVKAVVETTPGGVDDVCGLLSDNKSECSEGAYCKNGSCNSVVKNVTSMTTFVACGSANQIDDESSGLKLSSEIAVIVAWFDDSNRLMAGFDKTCALAKNGKTSCRNSTENDEFSISNFDPTTRLSDVLEMDGMVSFAHGDGACVLLNNGHLKCKGKSALPSDFDLSSKLGLCFSSSKNN